MIKRISWLLLVVAGHAAAQTDGKLRVQVSTGYEQENFRWSIAGNSAGQDPNVYSELKWRNVGGPSGRVDLEWAAWKRWQVFASGSRTFIRRGSVTDTDYGLDNRNDPLYHQRFGVSGGYSEAGSAGIGYSLLNGGPFQLTPFIGYSLNKQSFPITDPGGSYTQLNSSYDAKWYGPLARVDAVWQIARCWQVVAEAEYDQAVYHGVADWNLIPDFSHPVSFRHHADGYGLVGELGIQYRVSRHLVVSLKGDYFDWETGKGTDILYLNAGGFQVTQLNGVVRDGFGGRVGAAWTF